jgi:hypothetical protein
MLEAICDCRRASPRPRPTSKPRRMPNTGDGVAGQIKLPLMNTVSHGWPLLEPSDIGAPQLVVGIGDVGRWIGSLAIR